MKLSITLLVLAAITAVAPAAAADPADASDPRQCGPRGTPGRTECLQRLLQRGAATDAYNDAYLESLNQSMRRACAAAEAADMAARALRRSPNQAARWGGRVWTSARDLSEAALGQRGECDKLRREMRRR
jgi:hypothetical protein